MHMARCIPTGIHAFVLIFRLIDQIYTLINKFDLAVPRPGTAAKDGRPLLRVAVAYLARSQTNRPPLQTDISDSNDRRTAPPLLPSGDGPGERRTGSAGLPAFVLSAFC